MPSYVSPGRIPYRIPCRKQVSQAPAALLRKTSICVAAREEKGARSEPSRVGETQAFQALGVLGLTGWKPSKMWGLGFRA